MSKDYFVILNHPNGSYVPLSGENDEMMFFETYQEACLSADRSTLGSEYGFEVFMVGNGE